MTKDERLLVEIYRQILKSGKKDGTVNPEPIGVALGYKEHLVKNILKGLMQANLVKSYGESEVGLTERGRTVAQSLMV